MITVEQIKKYNELLREKKQQNERIKVEIEVNEKNINTGLKELSQKLGKEVTFENIDSIYEETMKSAELIVNNGMSIINGTGVAEENTEQAVIEIKEAEPVKAEENKIEQAGNTNSIFSGVVFNHPGVGEVQFVQAESKEESTVDSIDEEEPKQEPKQESIFANGGSLFSMFNGQ